MRKKYVWDNKIEKWVDVDSFEPYKESKWGNLQMFTPRWYNNIYPNPIYIKSRSELKFHLKKNNLIEVG